MSNRKKSGRSNNSGGYQPNNEPKHGAPFQYPQHMFPNQAQYGSPNMFSPNVYQNRMPQPSPYGHPAPIHQYPVGGSVGQNIQDYNRHHQQRNPRPTARSQAYRSNNQSPQPRYPAPARGKPEDAPPAYDQVCPPEKEEKPPTLNTNITQNIEHLPKDFANLNNPDQKKASSSKRGASASRGHKSTRGARGRGSSRGRGRGGLGGLSGGRLSSFAARGRRRGKVDIDRKSEVTVSSVGTERDDLSVEVQRQLISELEFPSVETDSTAVLIEILNGIIDFHPYALKNFLEYCTSGKPRVHTMIIASDKQSAIAIFESDIDCEELEMFVAEPQNLFLDYDLDFEEVDELSAAIVFTEDDITDYINDELESRLPGIKDHVKDHRQSDDIAVISFQGLSQNDLWHLMKTEVYDDTQLFPLYPYPSPEYMHVVRDSYFYYDNEVGGSPSEQEYTVLLSQVDDTLSDKEIKKVMTVEKFSGGDSTAKVHASPYDIVHQRLVTYSKAEVCLRVMSRSPIKMMTDGRMVGWPAMRADAVVENAEFLSRHFLLLTGVENTELTKHILQYFCANFARHTVQQVYFTRDGRSAVLMFSADIAARDPDFAALQNAFTQVSDEPIANSRVQCWRLQPVHQVSVSDISRDAKLVKAGIQKCKQDFDIDIKGTAVDGRTATLEFNDEKDVVKFLNSANKRESFGDLTLEFPYIGPLAGAQLYSDKLDILQPPSLALSNVVEDLGFSTDYLEYIKQSGDKKIVKMFNKCHTFWHRTLHELRVDQQILGKIDGDVVQLLKNWPNQIKEALETFLNGLTLMEEKRVPKADWFAVEKKKPSALFVMKESIGKHVKVKAIGSETDVDSLQQLLTGSKQDKGSTTKQITLSITDANYIKHHYLDDLQKAYPGPTINISLGSEPSTLVATGNEADVIAVEQAVEGFKGALKSRKMTIASPQWQFLNSRKSRAYLHFNGRSLKELGVQYYCIQKGTHQLVMLTATSSDVLSEAEKIIRADIVVEKYEMKSQQEWKEYTKPVLEKMFCQLNYPLHLIEPDESSESVTIVTAKLAHDNLRELLSAAKGEKTPTASSAKKPKAKKAKKKVDVGTASPAPSGFIGDVSSGAIPKRTQPLNPSIAGIVEPLDVMAGRGPSPIPSLIDLGRNSAPGSPHRSAANRGYRFSEEVKLSMSHQYIDYQFLSHYCHEVLDEESCDVTMEERTVTIRSNSADEAKRVKNRLLKLIQQKLNKETREVKDGVDERVFEKAAKDLKLRFLLNSSRQLLDYEIKNVSVVACKPSIQCIRADAVIIAVKDDLYMNQSGVGAVLAIADPKASKDLRSRFDSDMLDSAGSCQELDSYDSSTLYRLYLVIVVDPEDKDSLRRGFSKALRRCESLNISSAVTNLLGSDMKGFVNDKESASILLSCLSEHVRSLEKTRLQTLYMCETNQRKVDTLVSEVKKYGKGVQYVDSSLPLAGPTMISICSHTKNDGDEFFRRCAQYLA